MASTKGGTKNDPSKRKKSDFSMKYLNGKLVKPVLYIDREKSKKYMSAMYEDEKILINADGMVMKWEEISSGN